jgi:hypothetical protein
MRTTKELLELMLTYSDLFSYGLCCASRKLWFDDLITDEEITLLRDYLNDYKQANNLSMYWWPEGQIQPRIDWINEQIKLLSNEIH